MLSELENSRWIVPAKSANGLDLYIHRGLEYSATRAFTDVFLQLNLTDSDTYDLYKGDNCTVVEEDYRMDNRMFGLLKGVDLWKSHQLNVFNDTVVGVATRQAYSIHAKVLKVNYVRLGAFVAGILLFLFARQLVRNAVFYYGSGCSFGLLASLLIIVFIIYRVAPKILLQAINRSSTEWLPSHGTHTQFEASISARTTIQLEISLLPRKSEVAERDRGEVEYDSPYRRDRDERDYDASYLRKLKQREVAGKTVQKRMAPSSSNEFLSSDSDADIQEADLYPEDQFEYEA
ncbi:hypothetical protein ANCDUO_13268 [Ancylostoma duodenale]|uniref:Uncharacterized protein n=1 Tax=Ancylostoma duodenale TaxID=51022 RepID=A0A0C2GHK9_9BILA|nr:hypothetical protein ANCDUO_13268 [Ancylostoma duodenale]